MDVEAEAGVLDERADKVYVLALGTTTAGRLRH